MHSKLITTDPILPQTTIKINLSKNPDTLQDNMHEKTRYNIRLAQKRGVVAKVENDTAGLEKFIYLHEQTQQRQGYFSHNSEYYRLLFSIFHPHKSVFILNAYHPEGNTNTPIASMLLLKFKDTLYYPYGGSDRDYKNWMAPHLLYWHSILLGKDLGCKFLDLWSAYKYHPNDLDPWWGIYRIKAGLGGDLVHLPSPKDIPFSHLYYPFRWANILRWQLLKTQRKISSLKISN